MSNKHSIKEQSNCGLTWIILFIICFLTTLSHTTNAADVSFYNQSLSSDEFINAFIGNGSQHMHSNDPAPANNVRFRGISLKKSTPNPDEKSSQEEQKSFNQQVSANQAANVCLANRQSVAVNITFKPNSSKVTDTDLIKNIAKAMNSEKLFGCYFIIEGHTDAVGNNYYNLWLSQNRAGKVKQYLSQYDVLKERLVVVGKGEDELANNSVPNAAENRRVVFKVINFKR